MPPVLRALGLRLIPAPALGLGQFGPPSPPLIASPRKRTPGPAPGPAPGTAPGRAPLPPSSGPFAALAALRR